MIERLSGDYNRGYTKAIQDLLDVFGYIEDDIRHHKVRFTVNTATRLINTCLINRENLRENRNGFIRYNGQKKDFEWYCKED